MSPHPPLRSTRLLDQLRERIRYDHYSLKTEQSYVQWVRRFVHFHALRHPKEMGGPEVEAFLAHLANARLRVSRMLARAVAQAGIAKKVTAHTLRHSFATHAHAGGRCRHPPCAGAARAFGRLDDDDLHARAREQRRRTGLAAGLALAGRPGLRRARPLLFRSVLYTLTVTLRPGAC